MDPDFQHAINGDWDRLLAAMRDNRSLVDRTDSNGMTILHWICLHQDIPTEIMIKVVFANPRAVKLRNDAGHLPIDLAIQAESDDRVLEILQAAAERVEEEDAAADETVLMDDGHHLAPMDQHQYGLEFMHGDNNSRYYHENPEDNQIARSHRSHSTSSHQYHSGYSQQLAPYEETVNGQLVFDDHHPPQHPQRHQELTPPHYHGRPGRSNSNILTIPRSPTPSAASSRFPRFQQEKTLYSIYSGHTNNTSTDANASENPPPLKSLSLMDHDQRLRERENDMISCVTDDQNPYEYDTVMSQHPNLMMQNFSPRHQEEWKHVGGGLGTIDMSMGGVNTAKQQRMRAAFPPRWKQSKSCHVCSHYFSMIKRRHHCRNCGQSACGPHSTNRVSLPKYGLMEPQRICDKCFLSGQHLTAPATESASYVMPPVYSR